MKLRCETCKLLRPRDGLDVDFCEKLGEALPNGYAKLYWGGDGGIQASKCKVEARCWKCGEELPDHVPLGEFSCADGVPDICPFCGADLWCHERRGLNRVRCGMGRAKGFIHALFFAVYTALLILIVLCCTCHSNLYFGEDCANEFGDVFFE